MGVGVERDKFLQVCEHYREIHEGKTLAALTARYGQVLDRVAELESYARRSNTQDDELDQLCAERTVLDVAMADRQVAARSQMAAERAGKIAEITSMAQDPANLERPDGTVGAPALLKDARRDRLETAAEVIQRAGNPWRHEGGPLDAESGAGLAARAHAAVEALQGRLTHDGSEKLAGLLSLRPSTLGPYENRWLVRLPAGDVGCGDGDRAPRPQQRVAMAARSKRAGGPEPSPASEGSGCSAGMRQAAGRHVPARARGLPGGPAAVGERPPGGLRRFPRPVGSCAAGERGRPVPGNAR